MTRRRSQSGGVEIGFEQNSVRLKIADIRPLHVVSPNIKRSRKYSQIVSSIREIGIIEPPVVTRCRDSSGAYLLLDGHLRVEVLKELGETEVTCLVSTDDEGFTYNRRVNRLAIIQEHKMILKAIERGAPEKRIAAALNIDVSTLRHKVRLLDGICPEAAELLKDKYVASNAFSELRKMVPIRQIEAAELMIAMNKFTGSYARALLAATTKDQLVAPHSPKLRGLTDEQIALMEREASNLEREFKIAEQSYGTDHLDLVLAKGYLAKLLRNTRIVRYLNSNHQEILGEFRKIADMEGASA
ncbi:MAG: ParB N-terminal domain-containing protein [Alphaproteobacteria bacterium]|nr:ParB N-terminal domain-containing protein [Alphaproteobacteria bacterium]